MFQALKSQKVSLQLLLPVFGLLAYAGLFIRLPDAISVVHNPQGLLYSWYRDGLADFPLALLFGSYVLLVVFSSYLFWFNVHFEIIAQRTVLISYLYFFIAAIPLFLGYLHPGFLAAMVWFLGLVSIFSIYGKTRYLSRVFNAGIIFGISVILYPPYTVMIPVYLLAIGRMKQPALRDFIALILGIGGVIWLYMGMLWLTGGLAYQWESVRQWFTIRTTWPIPIAGNNSLQIIWLIWLLLTLPMTLSASRARKDAGRRVSSVLLQLLWFAPALLILFERVSLEVWSLTTIPLCILLAQALANSKRGWMYNLFFVGMIAFLIAFQILLFYES